MFTRGMVLIVGLASLNAMASTENTESQYSAFKHFQCVDEQGQQTVRFYFDEASMVAYVPTLPWMPSKKFPCAYSPETGALNCYVYTSPMGSGFTLSTSGEYQSYSKMCGFAGCNTTYDAKNFCHETVAEMTLQ